MIARLSDQQARRERTIHPDRAARTRTLIQAGGLLEKSGLLTLFGIALGEDLQHHTDSLEKATQLLGALVQFAETVVIDDLTHDDSLHTLGRMKLSQK